MPTLERFPISTAVVVAGWANPTNAYTVDNSYTTTSTNNAEQSYDYNEFLTGVEEIDKVVILIKYIYRIDGLNSGANATCTFSIKVYDGSSWTTYQVIATSYAAPALALAETLTDTFGNNSNSVVAIDVTSIINTLAKLNAVQTALLAVFTADAGLTPQVQVDCVGVLVCYHVKGDVFIGAAKTQRDLDTKEHRALKAVNKYLEVTS